MELFGIRFVGINPENGQKLFVTICFILAVALLRVLLHWLTNLILGGNPMTRSRFWTQMGQPPSTGADPSIWVRSRQFTGRIVTVANAKIFDDPIYNYTRDFPYIWDEIALPITYAADRQRAEEILLAAARAHALNAETVDATEIQRLREKYGVERLDLDPSVYYRITDNWLELTLRFLVDAHGVRAKKDKMSRQILKELDAAGIGIASTTYDIVGLPRLRTEHTPPSLPKSDRA